MTAPGMIMTQETIAIFSFFEKLHLAADACVGASRSAAAKAALKKMSWKVFPMMVPFVSRERSLDPEYNATVSDSV
jgi:hypothetical protein